MMVHAKESVFLTIAFCLMIPVSPAFGQATSNSNQIKGTLSFTNTNPQVVALLQDGLGLETWRITATSENTDPILTHVAGGTAAGALSTPFLLNAEAGSAGNGIVYRLTLGNNYHVYDEYLFGEITSQPLEEEPAPPIVLDMAQCAGIIHVTWVDDLGAPVAITGGGIEALIEEDGDYRFQASENDLEAGISEAFLPVRGDGTFQLKVKYTTRSGSDPYSDLILVSREVTELLSVPCDEVVEVVIQVPTQAGGTLPLGRIVGNLGVLGEVLAPTGVETALRALQANGNYRLDRFYGDGAFEFENLVPAADEQGYGLSAHIFLRSGERFSRLTTPFNSLVGVPEGATVDVGDRFVFDPGYAHGEIYLAGPVLPEGGSPLEFLHHYYHQDADGDGIPDQTHLNYTCRVFSGGQYSVPPGAYGAQSFSMFPGNLDAESGTFHGDYNMVLFGLNRGGGTWSPPRLDLFFQQGDATIPDSYYNGRVTLSDENRANLQVTPGADFYQPLRYCLSRVTLSVRGTQPFHYPNLTGGGSFQGIDFEGNPAHHQFNVVAAGTPNYVSDAAPEGQITMALPQGDYQFTPRIFIVAPDGSRSNTELPMINLEVGCRQDLRLTPTLQFHLEPLPSCISAATQAVAGSVSGTVEIASVRLLLNGEESVFCEGCGENPGFVQNVTPIPGENTLVVQATDVSGQVASVSTTFTYDSLAPTLDPCPDLYVDLPPGQTETPVTWQIRAVDNADGEVTVHSEPASGSLFSEGVTTVTCSAVDTCGNTTTCQFNVTVGGCNGAVDDTYSTDWDTPLVVGAPGLLVNDCDPEGRPLAVHILSGVTCGNLYAKQDGSFRYLPSPDCEGEVNFVYKAWYGSGYTTARVTIRVVPGNGLPIAEDDFYEVTAGTRLTVAAPGVLVNDVDPEGDPLQSFLFTTPEVGQLGFHQDGSLWYEAPSDYAGSVQFTYRASDGRHKTAATVTLHINP